MYSALDLAVLIGNGKCKQLSDWSKLELSTADRVIPISAFLKFKCDEVNFNIMTEPILEVLADSKRTSFLFTR